MVVRYWFYLCSLVALAIIGLVYLVWPPVLWFLILVLPLILLGIYDICQTRRNVLRLYPVWGHWRYILLSIRPMIQAYFIQTEQSGKPFSREQRFLVYSRALKTLDTLPFGTQHEVREVGYEWMSHSLSPKVPNPKHTRVVIGNEQCTQTYCASRLNVSAMSFGAISRNAVRALNRGAKMGNFYHNTGEGGLSDHH